MIIFSVFMKRMSVKMRQMKRRRKLQNQKRYLESFSIVLLLGDFYPLHPSTSSHILHALLSTFSLKYFKKNLQLILLDEYY